MALSAICWFPQSASEFKEYIIKKQDTIQFATDAGFSTAKSLVAVVKSHSCKEATGMRVLPVMKARKMGSQ